MAHNNLPEITESLRHLVAAYRASVAYFEQTIGVLCRELGLDESALSVALPTPPAAPSKRSNADQTDPVVDFSLLSIVYRGRRCFLGNTYPLLFFERLARQPNRYVPYETLLEDVWDGFRTNEAVRSVAHVLRRKLIAAGMEDLAQAIDGSNRGYFGLILHRK